VFRQLSTCILILGLLQVKLLQVALPVVRMVSSLALMLTLPMIQMLPVASRATLVRTSAQALNPQLLAKFALILPTAPTSMIGGLQAHILATRLKLRRNWQHPPRVLLNLPSNPVRGRGRKRNLSRLLIRLPQRRQLRHSHTATLQMVCMHLQENRSQMRMQ
jgi:hypothetical protein